MKLLDANGNLIRSVVTDSNGVYLFDGLLPGSYQVQIDTATLPPGTAITGVNGGPVDQDSNCNPSDGRRRADFARRCAAQPHDRLRHQRRERGHRERAVGPERGGWWNPPTPRPEPVPTVPETVPTTEAPATTLAPATTEPPVTLPLTVPTTEAPPADLPGELKARVSVDPNNNGNLDPGEQVLPKVKVEVRDADGKVVAVSETDANGEYRVRNLPPGKYTVKVVSGVPEEFEFLTEQSDSATVTSGQTASTEVPFRVIGSANLPSPVRTATCCCVSCPWRWAPSSWALRSCSGRRRRSAE